MLQVLGRDKGRRTAAKFNAPGVRMPKALFIDPDTLHNPSKLIFPEIPVHAYRASISQERSARGDAALVAALRHMMVIREFETMLGSLKVDGRICGSSPQLQGPGSSLDRPGRRRGRRSARARALRPHLRQPSQPWRIHRQGALGDRQADPAPSSWRIMEGFQRRLAVCKTVERHRRRRNRDSVGGGLSAVWPAGRNLHARERL